MMEYVCMDGWEASLCCGPPRDIKCVHLVQGWLVVLDAAAIAVPVSNFSE